MTPQVLGINKDEQCPGINTSISHSTRENCL